MWLKKTKESSLHKFVEKMYTVEQAPAFVPGRVLHITETGRRIRRRCVCVCVYVCVWCVRVRVCVCVHSYKSLIGSEGACNRYSYAGL